MLTKGKDLIIMLKGDTVTYNYFDEKVRDFDFT